MSIIGKYINGNYTVELYSDGTKVRHNKFDYFKPAFAESYDIKISDKCDGGCSMCYEGCTPNGEHGDIMTPKFLDTIPPYTEVAINGNDLSHPDLIEFLYKMKNRKVIVNMTVNQMHFEKNFVKLKRWVDEELIYGLGISLREPTQEFISMAKKIDNVIIHVINGVVSVTDLIKLADEGMKVLILGYKNMRRGESYYNDNKETIVDLQNDLRGYLFTEIIKNGWFDIVSFDNLAIEQLKVKDYMTEEQWEQFYMGFDGDFSFYIDAVEGVFAKNSVSAERYPIMDDVRSMFSKIKESK